jgi:hypothetical protein
MPTTAELERQKSERLTQFHTMFDQVLEKFGRRAPPPRPDQSINSYRREGMGYIQPFLHKGSKWRTVPLSGLMSDALNVAQADIFADAAYTASNPRLMATTPAARIDSLDPGIWAVKVVRGGKEFTEFYGESFVRAMSRPGRRVVGWNTSTGPVLASGNTRW